MAKDIERAKILLDRYLNDTILHNLRNPFTEYSKTYFWTNENIKGYLDLVSFEEKESALSVCAGGDHAFNLIERGILNIDTFDINRLTEYFAFGLKRAMILKYTYEEYTQISELFSLFARGENFIFEKEAEIIISLLPYMDSAYREFWRELIDYNYKLQKDRVSKVSLFKILTYGFSAFYQKGNSFLDNEDAYNTLKENLSNANITFKYADALQLGFEFKDNQYDFILLSNILQYFTNRWGTRYSYETLNNYIKRLERITKDKGIIFIQYLMQYEVSGRFNNSVSCGLRGNLDSLENEEVYRFDSITKSKGSSGIILKRVKK